MNLRRGSTWSPIKRCEHLVGFGVILGHDLQERPRVGVHRGDPERFGIHFAEALVAVDGNAFPAERQEVIDEGVERRDRDRRIFCGLDRRRCRQRMVREIGSRDDGRRRPRRLLTPLLVPGRRPCRRRAALPRRPAAARARARRSRRSWPRGRGTRPRPQAGPRRRRFESSRRRDRRRAAPRRCVPRRVRMRPCASPSSCEPARAANSPSRSKNDWSCAPRSSKASTMSAAWPRRCTMRSTRW